MKTSILLALLLASCADNATSDSPADIAIPKQPQHDGARVLSQDCDARQGIGTPLDTYAPDQGPLHVIGVYEARHDDPPWWAEPGCAEALDTCPDDTWFECTDAACDRTPHPHPATLHFDVRGTKPTTVVLASYEPTNWTVTVAPGAKLERVVLSGPYVSTADVPAGVTVETADLGHVYEYFTDEDLALTCDQVEADPGFCDALGDIWYGMRDERAVEARRMVEAAESYTHLKLGSFNGCYRMSELTLGDSVADVTLGAD